MPIETEAQNFLTPEVVARIHAHLNAKGKTDLCPFCGVNAWEPSGPAASLVVSKAKDGRLIAGTEAVPLLLLICSNCYYVMTMLWQPIVEPDNER